MRAREHKQRRLRKAATDAPNIAAAAAGSFELDLLLHLQWNGIIRLHNGAGSENRVFNPLDSAVLLTKAAPTAATSTLSNIGNQPVVAQLWQPLQGALLNRFLHSDPPSTEPTQSGRSLALRASQPASKGRARRSDLRCCNRERTAVKPLVLFLCVAAQATVAKPARSDQIGSDQIRDGIYLDATGF